MRKSKSLRFFLDSVNIAAVAVMLGVLVEMGMDTLVGWRSLVILAIGLWATFGTKKVNVMWLVIGSALLGYLLNLI
jgi:chromate transporter